MRKYVYSFLAITLLLANINIANAETLKVGQKITITPSESITKNDNDTEDNPQSIIHLYKANIGGGIAAYCEDSNLNGPANGSEYSTYTISDILDEKDSREAGLIEILKYTYNGGNQVDINVAIRIFNIKYGRTAGGSLYPFTTSAYNNIANGLCNGVTYTGSSTASNIEHACIDVGTGYKSILDAGIAASKKSSEASAGTTTSKISVVGPNETKTADDKTMVTYTFNNIPEIADVATTGKYPIKNLKLNKSSDKIGELQYKDKSGNWVAFPDDPTGKNFYDLAMANGKKLTIGFTYEKTSDEDCDELQYSITYEELGASKEYIAAEATATSAQRFLIIIKNEDGGEDGYTSQELTGAPECTPEEKQPCSTEITMPTCDDAQAGQDTTATVTAPTDIKKCIIKNSDDAGNTYQSDLKKNDYCALFCKEDYAEIKLNNVIEDVKCLGYFQLNAHIKGTKDCYLTGDDGNAIDINKLKSKINGLLKEEVDQFNEYSIATAYKNASNDCKTTYWYGTNPDTSIQEYYEETTCTVSVGSYIQYSYNKDDVANTLKKETVKSHKESFTDKCDDNGYGFYSQNTIPDGYTDATYEYCWGDSAEYKSKQYKNQYGTPVAPSDKTSKIKTEISAFDSCLDLDGIGFEFGQTLEWDYTEGRYTGSDTAGLDNKYSSLIGSKDKVLEPENTNVDKSGKIDYCNDGEVTDDFVNCDSSWQGSTLKETIKFFTCNTSGCDNPGSQDTRKAKYAKIHFTGESDYKTPSVYYQAYPSARIGTEQAKSLGFVELEEKLPTSPLLVGGGTYTIKVRGLGEFYDTKDIGRLIDPTKNSVSKKLSVSSSTSWDGDYVCHYYSPCQPEKCPDCKFSCEKDKCSWSKGKCPDCEFTCSRTGCLINMGDVKASTKTISLTALSSQASASGNKSKYGGSGGGASEEFREFGYNWNINTGIAKFELITAKAKETLAEIDEKNTTVYNDKNTSSSDSDLDFRITLTTSMIKKIKQYNDDNRDKGSYANDTMVCKPYTDSSGVEYENIFCYSTAIDTWMKDSEFKKNVTAPGREDYKKYWTPWTGEKAGLASNDKYSGGPSWK